MNKQIHFRQLVTILAAFGLLRIVGVGNADASPNDELEWHKMDQLCGSVVSVEPIKKVIRRPNGKSETLLYENPMKGVIVTLYKADGANAPCCAIAMKLGEVVTDHNGNFRFGDYLAGHYWLVVRFKDSEAKVPIETDKYDKRACEAPNMERVVFADATPKPKVEVRII